MTKEGLAELKAAQSDDGDVGLDDVSVTVEKGGFMDEFCAEAQSDDGDVGLDDVSVTVEKGGFTDEFCAEAQSDDGDVGLDDVSVTVEKGGFTDEFCAEMEEIREMIDKIQMNVEKLKKINSAILSVYETDESK